MVRSGGAVAAGLTACLAASVIAGLLGPANAQTAAPADPSQAASRLEALAQTLSEGISCASGNPRDALDERGRKSGAAPADIGAALAIISSSSDICPPVRAAASAMSSDLAAQQTAAIQTAQTAQLDPASSAEAAARASLANAALEAEIRAASTRFDLGPPPRNLTRGRIAGL